MEFPKLDAFNSIGEAFDFFVETKKKALVSQRMHIQVGNVDFLRSYEVAI
jgi:hypothetical protein